MVPPGNESFFQKNFETGGIVCVKAREAAWTRGPVRWVEPLGQHPTLASLDNASGLASARPHPSFRTQDEDAGRVRVPYNRRQYGKVLARALRSAPSLWLVLAPVPLRRFFPGQGFRTLPGLVFRTSHLRLRPVWHQTAERVEAHILVCFPAFVLWRTLGQFCRAAGLGDCPRKVLDELAQIQMVDVVLPTQHGPEIRLRCVSRPEKHQAILLQRLRMRLPNRIRITEM